MEMHLNSIVVSLLDGQGKAFREYDPKLKDNSRRCHVFMPFDTEYKILVKNKSHSRMRMDVDIDGTTVSGKGVIISVGATETLERFVDVAKKFKFVKAEGPDADPEVADPTNPENGLIKVRLYEESLPKPNLSIWNSGLTHWPNNGNGIWYTGTDVSYYKGSVMVGSSEISYSANIESSAGATVEGGKSDQKFFSTSWNGDSETHYTFTFYVRGTDTLESDPEYKEYLRLKNKFNH